jgi:hypothetical protein
MKKSKPVVLQLRPETYPSGAVYIAIYSQPDGKCLGRVNVVDGGYVVQGGRKVTPNVVLAARRTIVRRIQRLEAEIVALHELLALPVNADDVGRSKEAAAS